MVHFFDSDIAKKYGVNAAVLACFLWDCIEQKSTESPQLHEGKVWVRCSVQMMTGFFPFLSYDEIRYALKRLVKGRVLTKGQFNESRFDRTNWYAFTEFGQFLMAESEGSLWRRSRIGTLRGWRGCRRRRCPLRSTARTASARRRAGAFSASRGSIITARTARTGGS